MELAPLGGAIVPHQRLRRYPERGQRGDQQPVVWSHLGQAPIGRERQAPRPHDRSSAIATGA